MYNQDDQLDDALNRTPSDLEQQHGTQPADQYGEQIASLVKLAASIRELPHPDRNTGTIRAEKRRIMTAAESKNQVKRRFSWSRNGGFTGQWMVLPAVAGAALLVLMVFVLAVSAGVYFAGPRGAQAAELSSLNGVVEVLAEDGGWSPLSNGERIQSGQRVRTLSESWVTLTFFDGIQVTLEPDTDLVLGKVDGAWGRQLQVTLIQNEGETNHQVVPLQGEASTYQVMTPSGEASVRGTTFKVQVEETGNSVFSVNTGAVLVSNNGDQAMLSAGQSVQTELGAPLAVPSFLFSLQGELQQKLGKTWIVEGVAIILRGNTRVDGDPQEGENVLVTGRISKKGEWIADSIILVDSQEKFGTFSGVVTGVSDAGVEVAGFPLVLQGDQPQVNPGDLVRVQFMISDEAWVVLVLEPMGISAGDEPDPEPDPEPELEPELGLYFTPEEDGIVQCQPIGSIGTSLEYYPEDPEAPALQVSLMVTVEKGAEYIVPVTVIPESPFTIEREGTVPVKITLQLKEGLAELPPESEVKIRVTIQDVLSDEVIGDSFEYSWECDEELTEEEDPDDGDGDKCTRKEPHPHAMTIADEYGARVGVGYDQIWSWFCEDNLGFGEIEQAFKLYLEYGEQLGIDVHAIIAMRLEGSLGWGQIKQELKQSADELLVDQVKEKKTPPGKEKSEEAKNKDKPNKKDD